MQPIDFVYLWCDGSDPNFIHEKNFMIKKSKPATIQRQC